MRECGNGMKREARVSKTRGRMTLPRRWSRPASSGARHGCGCNHGAPGSGPANHRPLLDDGHGPLPRLPCGCRPTTRRSETPQPRYGGDPLKDMLDPAGTLVVAIGPEGG